MSHPAALPRASGELEIVFMSCSYTLLEYEFLFCPKAQIMNTKSKIKNEYEHENETNIQYSPLWPIRWVMGHLATPALYTCTHPLLVLVAAGRLGCCVLPFALWLCPSVLTVASGTGTRLPLMAFNS